MNLNSKLEKHMKKDFRVGEDKRINIDEGYVMDYRKLQREPSRTRNNSTIPRYQTKWQ